MSVIILKKFTVRKHRICPSCKCMIKKGEEATKIQDEKTGEKLTLCTAYCREITAEEEKKKAGESACDSLYSLYYT